MAYERQIFWVRGDCDFAAVAGADAPGLGIFARRGVLCPLAGEGGEQARPFREAAKAAGLAVSDALSPEAKLCMVDAGVEDVEGLLARAFELAERETLVVLTGKDVAAYAGTGFAKGKRREKPLPAASVAATLACIANFPVPEDCDAPVAYAAFKHANIKRDELEKLEHTINSMEAALARATHRPGKHDCA